MQFSLRTVFGVFIVVAFLSALPRWIGFAATGLLVGLLVPPVLVIRFKTTGFLIGLLIGWLSVSLGVQIHRAEALANDDITVLGAKHEVLAIWIMVLAYAFMYLAPIYLARAFFDFYQIRSRLRHKRR